MHGQAGEDLRLRADLDAVVKRTAGVEDLLDHFAELIDLQRKDGAIDAAVVVLADGALERAVERLDAMAEEILKADQDRRGEVHRLRFADDVDDRNGDAFALQRRDGDVTVRCDVEVSGAPAVDHVQRACVFHRPVALLGFGDFFCVRGQFLVRSSVGRKEYHLCTAPLIRPSATFSPRGGEKGC
jgi:hypothetical protein